MNKKKIRKTKKINSFHNLLTEKVRKKVLIIIEEEGK